jgi:hypothetical protein
LRPPQQAFPVGAADKLCYSHRPVNRFFYLFFENKFSLDFHPLARLVLFRTRRVIIRTSVCYATRFFKNFSQNKFSLDFHPLARLVLFRTRRVIVRGKKNGATLFTKNFSIPPLPRQKPQ